MFLMNNKVVEGSAILSTSGKKQVVCSVSVSNELGMQIALNDPKAMHQIESEVVGMAGRQKYDAIFRQFKDGTLTLHSSGAVIAIK